MSGQLDLPIGVARTLETHEFVLTVTEVEDRQFDGPIVVCGDVAVGPGDQPMTAIVKASGTSHAARTLCAAAVGDVLRITGVAEVSPPSQWLSSRTLICENPIGIIGWRRYCF